MRYGSTIGAEGGSQRQSVPLSSSSLNGAIQKAADALRRLQHPDGYWCLELEADCTIPAEYILMMHYMGEVDEELQAKIALYLREHQGQDGGWPLYYGAGADLSCSVKVYYALKLAGDRPDQPHMLKARQAVLRLGGAARANVFTRILLALFGQVPWRAVPFIPVECVLLPRWFPFHLLKVSYWSRTVMVPLFILCSSKAQARNPNRVAVAELFRVPPEEEKDYFPARSIMNRCFLMLDRIGWRLEPLIPRWLRRRAVARAEAWMTERLNGEGGLGAIFPAIVNAYEALDLLSYPADHALRAKTRQALQDLLVVGENKAYCQPCVSPVWDTAWACVALQEVGEARIDAIRKGLEWLARRQLLDEPGDWRSARPKVKGGGWPFQFENSHYPDLDDTAVVAFSMDRSGGDRFVRSVDRAGEWLCAMQSSNGGFASFDVDNDHPYLNEIPFADHGALLDPPTADVTARCVMLLARLARRQPRYRAALEKALSYLTVEQEGDGAWYGRWGTNYIYGTWSVLIALDEAGLPSEDERVRRAVAWLARTQRSDGGWGETNDSYFDPSKRGQAERSTSFHTAWALLGLMAGGEIHSDTIRRGIDFLIRSQQPDGLWNDPEFNAPGFPRVFYLKYHGYDKYFPLLALARYRKLALSENR